MAKIFPLFGRNTVETEVKEEPKKPFAVVQGYGRFSYSILVYDPTLTARKVPFDSFGYSWEDHCVYSKIVRFSRERAERIAKHQLALLQELIEHENYMVTYR